MSWKKGRGKLGVFAPLLGAWRAEGDGDLGPFICLRRFHPVLDGKFITLDADWTIGAAAKRYQEHCLFGLGADGSVRFWSFTSDGGRSEGWRSDAPDIHADALCFEAEMAPNRFARQIYWPAEDDAPGFRWAVESKTAKGWNRFVAHAYRAAAEAP